MRGPNKSHNLEYQYLDNAYDTSNLYIYYIYYPYLIQGYDFTRQLIIC